MKSPETKLIGTGVIEHPTDADLFGIRITFECARCKTRYDIDIFDNAEAEAFFQSLTEGKPNRDIICPKCFPATTIKP